MSEIIILDGADSVSLPHEVIDDIQDVWPERVQLASPSPGSYELRIPSGVGEGSLDVYRIENFHFAKRISYTTNDYPELTKKDEQAVSGNRR